MPDSENLPAVTDAPEERHMSGRETVAILLMLFGEEEAAEILARLKPQEVQDIGEAMFAIANVTEEEINRVFDRFVLRAGNRTTVGYNAGPQISGIINRALGPDRAANILTRIAPQQASSDLTQLSWMTASDIAEMIADEHPQIMAVVMSFLEPEVAGEVLQMLDEKIQDDVVFRVATMGPVSAEAIADIEKLLSCQTSSADTQGGRQKGGTSEAAAIMNNITKPMERRILKALTKRDKVTAKSIEEEMFVFADLIELDDKSLGTILRAVDNAALILALKGAEPELSSKMFGCMSSRAAQSIQDEIEEMGPVSKDEVVAAQKQVVAQARALAEDGTIMLGGQGDDFV